jgi:hypothetical protein
MIAECWVENLTRRHGLEDAGVDGRITLKMDLKRNLRMRPFGLDRLDSGKGPVTGCCTDGNEFSCSIMNGEFLGR